MLWSIAGGSNSTVGVGVGGHRRVVPWSCALRPPLLARSSETVDSMS